MNPGKRNVVVAAAFPPPLHGLSKISEAIASDLADLANVRRYNLSSRALTRSAAYHWRRLWSVFKAAAGILRNGLRANPCVYLPADGGLGLVYTLILTALGKISGQAIFIHHHSFAAIDQRSRLMAGLVAVAGPGATHIFLCGAMQRGFRDNYPGRWKAFVLSNAAHLSVVADGEQDTVGVLKLGLLSNLTREKGLHVFLDVMRVCAERGIAVEGRLAGPIESASEAAAVEAACAALGGRLSYLGPLYGADKDQFLSTLDVFVFPTSYRNEAQPNAVFEAMSAGAAIISFARGCLGEDVTEACGLLISPSEDFTSAACAQIAQWSADRSLLRSAKVASRRRFLECRGSAADSYRELLGTLAGIERSA